MVPYDGLGYGQANYWRITADDLAQGNGEFCLCWYNHLPHVTFSEDGKYKVTVDCYIKKDTCKKGFPQTSHDLTEIFMLYHKAY